MISNRPPKFSEQSILIQAQGLKAEGKYREAIELLEAGLENYPSNELMKKNLKKLTLLFQVKG